MVTRNPSNAHSPMMQAVQKLEASKELLRSDKNEDYVTAMEFPDRETEVSFCQCLKKARKHHLTFIEEFVWDLGKTLVATKGRRAMMYSQTIANLLVPEFYGGKDVQSAKHNAPPAPNA